MRVGTERHARTMADWIITAWLPRQILAGIGLQFRVVFSTKPRFHFGCITLLGDVRGLELNLSSS